MTYFFMILGSYEFKLLNGCGMVTHDQVHTQKHIPVVKANSFKDKNKQISFLLEKVCPELGNKVGPSMVVSDQLAYNLRSQGRKAQPFSSHGYPPYGQPGF